MEKTKEQIAIQTARNSIIANVCLTLFKLIAGIASRSTAMISDAVHSLADLFSTTIAIIGVKLANKKADKDHPYGHERFECVAAILLAILICATGLGIGWAGVQSILSDTYFVTNDFASLALIAAVVSIVVKEGMYWYVRRTAIKIDSSLLMADATHSRLDALSSIGSFIGIGGAMLGFPMADALAALAICIFILKTGFEIFTEAVGKMTDRACDDETIEKMRQVILKEEQVQGIYALKTRLFGNKIYMEAEICLDPGLSLEQADQIAQRVHDAIELHFSKVKHCLVRALPCKQEQCGRCETQAEPPKSL